MRRPLPLTLALALLLPTTALAGEAVDGSGLVTFTLPGPGGNGGMYYPDVQDAFPGVDWSQLDRLYIPSDHYRFINLGNLPRRSPSRKLVITNLGGQVRVGGLDFHYQIILGGGSNWVLSGRWDPGTATGHPDFPGHANGDYAGSRGRYGFLIDDEYESNTNSGLGIGGGASDFEIEFVEIARVGFAGVLMKTDNAGNAHMENVRFHDNYIHDTESEGVYIGSTQGQPQHKITGIEIYNNRLVRTGTEAVQLGQMGGGSEIHHNVIAFAALDWKSPFQPFQDNNTQLGCREGPVGIHHNLFVGGATFFILFSQDVAGDTHSPTDLVHIHDNYFSHSRNIGAYIHSQANGVATLRFEDNLFRQIDFQYDELDPGAPDHDAVFRIFNTENPIELLGNRWEGGQSFAQVAGGNVIQNGNVNGPVAPVEFRDSGFPADFDYLRLEVWADTSTITNEPVFYGLGDLVMHLGELYECIEPGLHTGKEPPLHPETWTPRPLPPDDFRLAPGSPHQGMGLLDGALVFADGFESGGVGEWSGGAPPPSDSSRRPDRPSRPPRRITRHDLERGEQLDHAADLV